MSRPSEIDLALAMRDMLAVLDTEIAVDFLVFVQIEDHVFSFCDHGHFLNAGASGGDGLAVADGHAAALALQPDDGGMPAQDFGLGLGLECLRLGDAFHLLVLDGVADFHVGISGVHFPLRVRSAVHRSFPRGWPSLGKG